MSWLDIVLIVWGVSALVVVFLYAGSMREHRRGGGT